LQQTAKQRRAWKHKHIITLKDTTTNKKHFMGDYAQQQHLQPLSDEEIVALEEVIESAEKERIAMSEEGRWNYRAHLDIQSHIDTDQWWLN
jgi:hypothetical protein